VLKLPLFIAEIITEKNEERKAELIEAVRNGSAAIGSTSIYMENSIFRMRKWSIQWIWHFPKIIAWNWKSGDQ